MKRFLFLCIWLIVIDVRAAVPTFESFSTNQFQTNILQVFYRDPHTNDAGIIYPALANTLTLVTNENVYGTFSLPAKVTLLALGTNYLDVTTNTTWLLNSPTNDATQVTISLSAGAYQGQLLFVTSQNGSNSFTLPDLSEQWDVPGAYVDIQGDWVGTTNRGIILQYTAPDWIEMARFDPGQTGGGTVFGSGTVPNFPYWITPTTLGTSSLVYSNNNNIRLDSTNTVDSAKFLIQGPSGVAYMDVDGTGQVAHFQGGSVTAWFANNNQRGIIAFDTVLAPSVNNTIDLGNPTGLRWKNFALDGHISWNGSTNSLFDTWGAGTPEGSVTARPGSIYRDTDAGEIYKKATGTGAAGWIALSSGAASALWASAGGVLEPSPAIDLVRIESQLADNATNVALVVDTSVPWGNGTALARYANAGTNVAVIGSRGELYLGAGGVASFPQSFDSIFSYNDESLDGLTANRMFLGTRDSSGYNYYGEVQISSGISSTNSPDSGIALQSLGADSSYGTGGISVSSIDQFIYLSNQLNLHPTVSSTGSATAYTFDTANVLTNGDQLVTVKNAGTEQFHISPRGGGLELGGRVQASFAETIDNGLAVMKANRIDLGDPTGAGFQSYVFADGSLTTGNYGFMFDRGLTNSWIAGSGIFVTNVGFNAITYQATPSISAFNIAHQTSNYIDLDAVSGTILTLNFGNTLFQADGNGVLTSAPSGDTARAWKFGSEAVISTVTNLIVSVNGVKYSVVATPR